jgi:hypothetical protein
MYVKKIYNIGKHKEIIEVHNFFSRQLWSTRKKEGEKRKGISRSDKKTKPYKQGKKNTKIDIG